MNARGTVLALVIVIGLIAVLMPSQSMEPENIGTTTIELVDVIDERVVARTPYEVDFLSDYTHSVYEMSDNKHYIKHMNGYTTHETIDISYSISTGNMVGSMEYLSNGHLFLGIVHNYNNVENNYYAFSKYIIYDLNTSITVRSGQLPGEARAGQNSYYEVDENGMYYLDNGISYYEFHTKSITKYKAPDIPTGYGRSIGGLAYKDGKMWFQLIGQERSTRPDTKSTFIRFDIRTGNIDRELYMEPFGGPISMDLMDNRIVSIEADPDTGHYSGTGEFELMDYDTGKAEEYSTPFYDRVDLDNIGMLWIWFWIILFSLVAIYSIYEEFHKNTTGEYSGSSQESTFGKETDDENKKQSDNKYTELLNLYAQLLRDSSDNNEME